MLARTGDRLIFSQEGMDDVKEVVRIFKQLMKENRQEGALEVAKKMAEDYRVKKSLAQLGADAVQYGMKAPVTRERVRQLLSLLPKKEVEGFGARITPVRKRAIERMEKQRKFRLERDFKKCEKLYGCTLEEYQKVTGENRLYGSLDNPLLAKYITHKRNANRFGIPWSLTLVEYEPIVRDHLEKWNRYTVLGRKDKGKGFVAGNVEVTSLGRNSLATRVRAIQLKGMKPIPDIATEIGKSVHTVKSYLYRDKNLSQFGDGESESKSKLPTER